MSGFGVGILGHPLRSASLIDRANLEQVKSTGATCVGVRCTAEERATPESWAAALRTEIEGLGLRCAQVVSEHSLLIAESEDQRRQAAVTVASGVPVAAALGAESLLIAPGGFSPAGPWWYHPVNFTSEARRALVQSLREIAVVAEEHGVVIAVEGYRLSAISSPEIFAALLSEVPPPCLRANLDYVNFIGPSDIPELGAYLDKLVDMYDGRVASMHTKDVRIADELSMHLDEVPPGEGLLDLDDAIHVATRLGIPMLLEHLEEVDPLPYLEQFTARVARVRAAYAANGDT
jgi:sugar phosphate isomerase/epimerase